MVTERRKGSKGRKSVKSDVDALKFDGEAAYPLNGEENVLKGDGEALNGDGEVLNGDGNTVKGDELELKCAG